MEPKDMVQLGNTEIDTHRLKANDRFTRACRYTALACLLPDSFTGCWGNTVHLTAPQKAILSKTIQQNSRHNTVTPVCLFKKNVKNAHQNHLSF